MEKSTSGYLSIWSSLGLMSMCAVSSESHLVRKRERNSLRQMALEKDTRQGS